MPEQQRLNFSAAPHTVGSLLWWRRIDCCPFGGNTHLLVLVHLAFLSIHHSWCYPSVFCGFFTSRLSWCCFIRNNWGPDLFCCMGTPVSSWAFGIEGDKDICVSPKFKMNPTKGTFWGGTPLKGQSPLRLLGGSIFLKIGTAAPLDFGSVLHQKDLHRSDFLVVLAVGQAFSLFVEDQELAPCFASKLSSEKWSVLSGVRSCHGDHLLCPSLYLFLWCATTAWESGPAARTSSSRASPTSCERQPSRR